MHSLKSLVYEAFKSRVAWVVATLHALWFFLAIANMSPPDEALGQFFDEGGGASEVLFAGRPFHFTYESWAMKMLVLADIPGTLLMFPVAVAISPFIQVGHYMASYITAGLEFIGGTFQWLLIGRVLERRVGRQSRNEF